MRPTRHILILMMLTLIFAAGCGSDDDPTGPGRSTIMVLGDGGTEGHVISTLKGAGFSVKNGGLFHEFTGEGLGGVDAVVLLAGIDYNHDMDDRGETALVAFVSAGGGLLATEWLAFSASKNDHHQIIETVLPVTYAGGYADGSETYSVLVDHPVTKGLPATFDTGEDSQYAVVGPRSGAVQLVHGDRSGHAVVTWTRGGRVVSWNMAGEYAGEDVWNAGMNRLLVNAAGYVAGEGEDPPSYTKFEIATGFMNVTYDGDNGSEGDFYITMEIFDDSAGDNGAVVAQDRILYQVESGRVISPGMVVGGDVPETDGRVVYVHVSIYENDPDGPQDAHGVEYGYVYDKLRDCWTRTTDSDCTIGRSGTLNLRHGPGEPNLHTDLNWTLTINSEGK